MNSQSPFALPSKSLSKFTKELNTVVQRVASWQKTLLAGLSFIFLAVGAILASTDILEIGGREYVSGTLLKVGFVLGIVWLAAPQLERFGWDRLRGSLLLALIVVLILWAIRPRIGAIAGALVVGGSLLYGLAGWVRKLAKPPEK